MPFPQSPWWRHRDGGYRTLESFTNLVSLLGSLSICLSGCFISFILTDAHPFSAFIPWVISGELGGPSEVIRISLSLTPFL